MLRYILPNKEDRKKYYNFMKRVALANLSKFPGGAIAASLSDLFTDNPAYIGLSATLGSHAATALVFYTSHIKDNKDIYIDEKGRRRYWEFIKDQIKLSLGFIPLYAIYTLGKPTLAAYFIRQGIAPALASLFSDALLIPITAILSAPVAKLTGNIRVRKPTLEDNINN